MKAFLKTKEGETKSEIELPQQFEEKVRPDLIRRAVLSLQSRRRQPYSTDPEAGKKYSSKLSRRRRAFKGAYGIGISRVPRKTMSRSGSRFNWEGATAPNTRGGRQAHPPKVEKRWEKEINKKERRKAIRTAMAASVIKEFVEKRGHFVQDYPIVVENDIENINKTKDALAFFKKIGISQDLEKSLKKTEKTGKAQRRGRTKKQRKSALVVVSKKCNLMKSASNIPGVDIVDVASLNAELLAPGGDLGRLTIYTKGAIDILEKEKLFMEAK